MPLTYNDISDIRYNSFTGEYNPIRITGEEHVIPSFAPYIITLNESPQRTVPSNIVATIKETSQILTEKSKTTNPGSTQFNVNYDELANGQVRVNATHAGKTLSIDYNGLGTLLKKDTLLSGLPRTISGENYSEKIINLGPWDMDNDNYIAVDIGVNAINVRSLYCIIRRDGGDNVTYALDTGNTGMDVERNGFIRAIDDGVAELGVVIYRKNGGLFDSAVFSDTGINRGYLYVLYKEE